MNRPGNERYRDGNARQIQAIKAAIDSLNKGTLKPAAASSIKVYDGKWKNHSKKLENGLYRAYRLEINCHMSGPSPWELIIEEGDVPVDIEANNKQIIRLKELQNRTAKRIYMGRFGKTSSRRWMQTSRLLKPLYMRSRKAYMEANSYYFLQKKRGQGAGSSKVTGSHQYSRTIQDTTCRQRRQRVSAIGMARRRRILHTANHKRYT